MNSVFKVISVQVLKNPLDDIWMTYSSTTNKMVPVHLNLIQEVRKCIEWEHKYTKEINYWNKDSITKFPVSKLFWVPICYIHIRPTVQHNYGVRSNRSVTFAMLKNTQQNKIHTVSLNLPNPIIIRLTSAHFENSSYICSSVV
jgi:hypothetical protein